MPPSHGRGRVINNNNRKRLYLRPTCCCVSLSTIVQHGLRVFIANPFDCCCSGLNVACACALLSLPLLATSIFQISLKFLDELPTTKYSIPLSGYGGACEVHVEDLDESDQSHSPLHNEYTPQCYVMSCDGKTASK